MSGFMLEDNKLDLEFYLYINFDSFVLIIIDCFV